MMSLGQSQVQKNFEKFLREKNKALDVEEDEDVDGTEARREYKEKDQDEDEEVVVGKRRSLLRTRNDPGLSDGDHKYRGVKISRKEISREQDADDLEQEQAEWGHLMEGNEEEEEEGETDQEEEEEEDDEMGSLEEEEEEEKDSEEEEEEMSTDAKVSSSTDSQKEVQKGLAIKRQMETWEAMLECRIQLQKVIQKVNRYE